MGLSWVVNLMFSSLEKYLNSSVGKVVILQQSKILCGKLFHVFVVTQMSIYKSIYIYIY